MEFDEIYQRVFGTAIPAWTTVGVQLNGFLVEIDCIALADE